MPSTPDAMLDPLARVKALSSQASSVPIDCTIPIHRYYRSGKEMVRMAEVYEQEGNYECAFILYMKFMVLFMEKIEQHPDYAMFHSKHAAERIHTKKTLKEVLPRAEEIKNSLLKRYQREYELYIAEQRIQEERFAKEKQEKEQKERWLQEEEMAKKKLELELSKDIISDGTVLELKPSEGTESGRNIACSADINKKLYPESEEPGYYDVLGSERTSADTFHAPEVPSRDLKPTCPSAPSVDRSTKPLSLLSATADHKSEFRAVLIPEDLLSAFLKLAAPNTFENIETCGILAGKLAQNKFIITHLLIPKQHGTSDSCTAVNEEEIFCQQDHLDLITLGWIHTHPTQTAFLSSVDVHNHFSYQQMMPEAIAIVCAPKFNETGYFNLTSDYGLEYISKCQNTGFHLHPSDPPIYQAADHTIVDSSLPIAIVDLRN